MYKYLFGPVPSRRFGMSFGVDLVPKKVCSLNCVYCEVGHTTKLTTERREYILYDKVTSELEHYFTNNPNPDYITFSGSGEPTLNSRIGDVSKLIKQEKPYIPVAVLTNGALLYDKRVRNELMDANVVLPSLDAATGITFQKIVDYWNLNNVEIIAAAPERKNIQSYRKDAESAILGTITRRPCTVDDLVKILGLHINEINKYLDVLEAEGNIEPVRKERGLFYKIKYK